LPKWPIAHRTVGSSGGVPTRWWSAEEYDGLTRWLQAHQLPAPQVVARDVPISAPHRGTQSGIVTWAESFWVDVPLTTDWHLALRIMADPESARAVIAELRVFPYEGELTPFGGGRWSAEVLGYRTVVPKGGLGMNVIRKITMGRALGAVRSRLSLYRRDAEEEEREKQQAEAAGRPWKPLPHLSAGIGAALVQLAYATLPAMARRPQQAKKARGGRGRPPLSDRHYAELARDYVALVRLKSRAPIRELAARRNESRATIRSALHRARRRQFLTSDARQGVVGKPELTAAARTALHHQYRGQRHGKGTRHSKSR
jgi:hypothetical protein